MYNSISKPITIAIVFIWSNTASFLVIAQTNPSQSKFSEVLDLAGIKQESLEELGNVDNRQAVNWQLISQLNYRLKQYSDQQLSAWAIQPVAQEGPNDLIDRIGDLYKINGYIETWKKVGFADSRATVKEPQNLYECNFTNKNPKFSGTLLSTYLPKRWLSLEPRKHPVTFLAVLLQAKVDSSTENQVVMLTNKVSWYPTQGVPSGALLLAKLGMDVSLFDEVAHFQSFVSSEISRESDAFYRCLTALSNVSQEELIKLCQENVKRVAESWRSRQPKILEEYETLQTQLNSSAPDEKTALNKKFTKARQLRSVANAVLKQSQHGESSVGPLFFQPKEEVGELVHFTGLARRAIRIAVPERNDIESYYELEVFAPEAKYLENRPLVCCVARLPDGFPQGDLIREPVSISGVFFKCWRYRTRNSSNDNGETNSQSRLYTPLIISSMPTWNQQSLQANNSWEIWSGIAFLLFLSIAWLNYLRSIRHQRQSRRSMQPKMIDEL